MKSEGIQSCVNQNSRVTYSGTQLIPFCEQDKKMIIYSIPTIDFNKCHPERCDHGICVAGGACPHKVFFQEQPYDFPMHIAAMCVGCGSCSSACPFKAIRMV